MCSINLAFCKGNFHLSGLFVSHLCLRFASGLRGQSSLAVLIRSRRNGGRSSVMEDVDILCNIEVASAQPLHW